MYERSPVNLVRGNGVDLMILWNCFRYGSGGGRLQGGQRRAARLQCPRPRQAGQRRHLRRGTQRRAADPAPQEQGDVGFG